jgi:hypothetical protein
MTSPDERHEARIAALLDVTQWRRRPISEAVERLREFPWDSDDELVTMTRADGISCLDLYLTGSITADDVNVWAEALEGRDDVAFDTELLSELLFELANPEITEPLSENLAQRWQRRLRT